MRSTRPLLLAAFTLVGALAWGAQPSKRPSDEERGKELYERHCVQCHGVAAAGDGPVAAALVKPVPDLRSGALTADNREDHVAVVLSGKGLMPAYEASFDRYDARRVLRYMESVARDPSEAAPAHGAEPAPVETEEPADGPDGD